MPEEHEGVDRNHESGPCCILVTNKLTSNQQGAIIAV